MKRTIYAAVIAAMTIVCSCKEEHQSKVTFEQDEMTVEWTVQGAKHYVYLLDGNGGYTWSFNPEGIAQVKEIQYGTVTLLINMPGTTTLTVTDRMETSDSLTINVTVPENE